MTNKKSGGLGRGLGSILPEIDIEAAQGHTVTTSISSIPLDKIVANPFQPRKEFTTESLEELAQSIKRQGVITPITVRQLPDGTYQLIAGERRTRASRMAGLTEIPAYIRIATDTQMMEMAIVENIQREDLNPMEVALAYNALIEECKLTHDELSERIGKKRSTISNYLRLLNLPAETQLALINEDIGMAHARALVNVEDIDQHLKILHNVVENQLTARDTEQLVKTNKNADEKAVRHRSELPLYHASAQKDLQDHLKATVEVKRSNRGKGSIVIKFISDGDFDRIMRTLQGQN